MKLLVTWYKIVCILFVTAQAAWADQHQSGNRFLEFEYTLGPRSAATSNTGGFKVQKLPAAAAVGPRNATTSKGSGLQGQRLPPSVEDHYDCYDGLIQCDTVWSSAQKDWCRANQKIDCGTGGGELQRGPEKHESEESVKLSLTVDNVDYERLRMNPSAHAAFEHAMKQVIAFEAGDDVAPEHIELVLSAGSVRVEAIINSSIQKWSKQSLQSLRERLVNKLSKVPSIVHISTGKIRVSEPRVSMEESEEAWTEIDIGIGETLIGAIGINMVLFYLVNWRDLDIRRYTWSILSTTISIFISVLVFRSLDELIDELLGQVSLLSVHLLVCYFLLLGLLAGIQVTAAKISGAMFEREPTDLKEGVWVVADATHTLQGQRIETHQLRNQTLSTVDSVTKSIACIDGAEVFVIKLNDERDSRTVRMKCYVSLLTYMAGFAAISAGGTLQQHEYFSTSPPRALVAVLIAQVILHLLFILFRIAMQFYMHQDTDQQSTPFHVKLLALVWPVPVPEEIDDRKMLWEDGCREAEKNISCLSSSFLLVQVLRFQISGVLPDKQGYEEPAREHLLLTVLALFLAGLVAGTASIGLARCSGKTVGPAIRNGIETLQHGSSMVFAWCTVWAARWLVAKNGTNISMAWHILLAMVASSFSCLLIFWLDYIEDMVGQEGLVGGFTQSTITALSLWVGFSWQTSFENAVICLASLSSRPACTEWLVTIVVVAVVLPAWRNYILVKVHRYDHMKKTELNARKAAENDHVTRARFLHVKTDCGSQSP